MTQCQNVCGRTVPYGYRLCPTCQACANQRVQLVRAELEANCDRLRAENERLRSENMKFHMYGDFRKLDVLNELTDLRAENERLRTEVEGLRSKLNTPIVECCHCNWIGHEYDIEAAEPGLADDPGQCPSCKTPNDWSRISIMLIVLRDKLQAANLTIEARSARLAEARAEIADLRKLVEAVTKHRQYDTQSLLNQYRARWQSGEKENEA